MRAGNVADGVNHRQNDQTKRQRNADVGDRAVAGFVDDNRARARETRGRMFRKFQRKIFSF